MELHQLLHLTEGAPLAKFIRMIYKISKNTLSQQSRLPDQQEQYVNILQEYKRRFFFFFLLFTKFLQYNHWVPVLVCITAELSAMCVLGYECVWSKFECSEYKITVPITVLSLDPWSLDSFFVCFWKLSNYVPKMNTAEDKHLHLQWMTWKKR